MESDKDQSKSAILVFCLGLGSTLLEEATTDLSEREAELANETEKDNVVERCDQVCQFPKAAWKLELSEHLDEAVDVV